MATRPKVPSAEAYRRVAAIKTELLRLAREAERIAVTYNTYLWKTEGTKRQKENAELPDCASLIESINEEFDAFSPTQARDYKKLTGV